MISGTEIDVYGNCKVGVNFGVTKLCSFPFFESE